MIKDALEFIFNKANEGHNPKPFERSIGPRSRVITLLGKESIEEISPKTIVRHATSIDSVAVLISEFGGNKPTAFVSEDGIKVVLDNSDRVEQISMAFEHSVQYDALRMFEAGLTQRTMVRSLRTTLAGCVRNAELLTLIRQLEFNISATTHTNKSHQADQMGRTIDKAVRAKAGDMPETVVVQVPLYSVPHDLPTEISITCAIEIDIDSERISLIPEGDSLERERRRILNSIKQRLESVVSEGTIVVTGTYNL